MRIRYLLALFALLTASCASTQEISRLIPEAPEGHVEMGREYIPLHDHGIDAELGFDGRFGETLVFDFVVMNGSDAPLKIDPSDFYVVMIDHPQADSSLCPPSMALPAAQVLGAYDRQVKEQEDRRQMNKVLGFIDAGIGILATASAFAATDHPGYIADAVLQTIGTADQYMTADHLIEAQMHSISMEREVVREEIFRAQELPAGKAAHGFVYFPAVNAERYLMFCFPMEDHLFQFVYRQ